ncbi:bifunctional protein hldE, domain II [Blochmannia endosymbiont of Camponotus (Colobopsis) obliquus]|nr:bifunctional protein hldE, domain II [Blochmannia endosymbiont of Camponotus (Colobopsis) obliquus]
MNCIFGIVDQKILKTMVLIARKHYGEKIVMTNGIFDLLHVGHVYFLANAKKLGDRLIVAVNCDFSTKKLKGNLRPINGLSQRMTLLAALRVVDWVVPFYEDNPCKLIADLLPDVLVKGGDYQSYDIAGSKEVLANGGEVRILKFRHGYSTSNIINIIQSVK